MKNFNSIVSWGVILAFLGFGSYTVAQNEDEDAYIEEVIVTAEKREENILDVPVTMTAFSSQSIEELGMTNNDDLEQLVPGLQFQDEGQQTGQGTTIRGIGTRLAGETHPDLAVATYVDGVYTLGTYGVAPNMFDLERVEVARGPQGTLNGRNSIAGSISYFYTKPTTEEWDLLIHSELTDQFSQRYGIAFGGPVSDNVSFRINGSYFDGDGAQENIGYGGNYDAPDQTFISPQLRFHTEQMDLNIRYSKLDDDGSPRSQVLLSNFDSTTPTFTTLGQTRTNAFYRWAGPLPSVVENCPPQTPAWECGDITNALNVNRASVGSSMGEQSAVAFSYDLNDNFTLRYNYGDTDNFSQVQRDRDMTNRIASANDRFTAADADVPLVDEQFEVFYDYTESSHELQLVSDFDGSFNFIAGLFTYENHTAWGVPSFVYTNPWAYSDPDEVAINAGFAGGCADALALLTSIFGAASSAEEAIEMGTPGNYWQCPAGTDHAQWLLFRTTASSETQAAFINADFEINDQWLISGGMRYTKDRKTQEENGGFAKFGFGFVGGVPLEVIFDDSDPNPRTWDKPIGHVSLEFSPEDDRLIYGRISTGYRAGSFNPKSDAVPQFVKEETLVNYELGMKGLYMDGRLRLTSGLFYNTFDNYQITGSIEPQNARQRLVDGLFDQFSATPIIEFTDNIDDTKIWGAEVDFIYLLNDNWRLSGFYAYLDSQIGPHLEVIRGDPNPRTGTWTHIDFSTGMETTSEYVLPTDMTGHQLPMQPNHKWALSASYERPLVGALEGDLQLLGTYSWVDERASDLSNLPVSTLPAYSRFDLRGTWTSPSKSIATSLFVQNVFDEIGVIEYLHVSTIAGNPAQGTLTKPRQIGLEVRWRPQL